jgi:hypothetical protein
MRPFMRLCVFVSNKSHVVACFGLLAIIALAIVLLPASQVIIPVRSQNVNSPPNTA